MGVIQGYIMVTGLFEICQNIENRVKLVGIDIFTYEGYNKKEWKELSLFMEIWQNCQRTRLSI